MTLAQIRSEFHRVIDEINDPEKLEMFLNMLTSSETEPGTSLLTDEEYKEVMESLKESEDPSTLVPWEEVKKNLGKWLSK